MRLSPLLVLVALTPACGYSYHPEYHPVTSVNYAQTVGGSTPAVVTAPPQSAQAPQQQIVVAPAGATAQFPAPPPPPTPPENFPW